MRNNPIITIYFQIIIDELVKIRIHYVLGFNCLVLDYFYHVFTYR
jgi:hypothetical protein